MPTPTGLAEDVCMTCAAYQGAGRSHVPPLWPILVGGPFETVSIDVLEML